MDVKNAFPNGVLEEEIFMNLQLDFEEIYGGNKTCKL